MKKYAEALDHQLTLSSRLRNDRFAKSYTRTMTSEVGNLSPEHVGYALRDSQTYYVTEEMCDLVSWAWRDMPPHPIEAAHLPSPFGWAWLEKPYVCTDVRGEPVSHRALSWMQARDARTGGNGIFVMFYGDLDIIDERERANLERGEEPGTLDKVRRHIGRIHAVHSLAWQYGQDWHSNETMERMAATYMAEGLDAEQCKESHRESFGWMTAFFAIVNQDMGKPEIVEPGRKDRRRAEREGKENADIRVVYLRRHARPEPEEGDEPGDGPKRKMKVKTYVKPFWRRQWYPKDQVHRLILIPPHVRGPEDAPWSPNTVKVVRR